MPDETFTCTECWHVWASRTAALECADFDLAESD